MPAPLPLMNYAPSASSAFASCQLSLPVNGLPISDASVKWLACLWNSLSRSLQPQSITLLRAQGSEASKCLPRHPSWTSLGAAMTANLSRYWPRGQANCCARDKTSCKEKRQRPNIP
jgi:hypothetical protein